MRQTLLFLAAGVLLWNAASLRAQEQERGLQQRLLEPDETLAFHGWKNGFNPGKSTFNASKARVKDFQFEQKVNPKNYVTRDFRGTKGAWEGEFLFKTEAAPTEGRYIIPKKDKEYETGAVETKRPHDSDRKARTQEYATRKVQLRGKAQGAIDEQYNQDKKPMSIDEVRALLNRSE